MRSIYRTIAVLTAFSLAPLAWGQTRGPAMPYPPAGADKPISVPGLGKYQPDKGAADPVAEASRGMIGWFTVTTKPSPAPYVRSFVADPFENRNLLQVQQPLPEEPAPPLLMPRK
jgi:hypothetical protein